jgi:hypothetical protein
MQEDQTGTEYTFRDKDAAFLWKEIAGSLCKNKVKLRALISEIKDWRAMEGPALEEVKKMLAADAEGMVSVEEFDRFCGEEGLKAKLNRIKEEVFWPSDMKFLYAFMCARAHVRLYIVCLCVCLCVCEYIYIYIYIDTHTEMRIVCVCAYYCVLHVKEENWLLQYVCMHVCMYVCVCVCVIPDARQLFYICMSVAGQLQSQFMSVAVTIHVSCSHNSCQLQSQFFLGKGTFHIPSHIHDGHFRSQSQPQPLPQSRPQSQPQFVLQP